MWPVRAATARTPPDSCGVTAACTLPVSDTRPAFVDWDATGRGTAVRYLPFIRYLQGIGLSGRSVDEYRRWVARADRWLAERGSRLIDARPHEVRAWCEADVPHSWASRKQARTALGHWVEFVGHVQDLARAVPVPAKPRPDPTPLPADEAQRVEHCAFSLLDDDSYLYRAGMATLLGLYIGLRRIEIARASWECDGGDRWVWQRAKSGRVDRLPIHPRLRSALDVYESNSAWLFTGQSGGHVHPATVWKWIDEVAGRARVDATPQTLRQTSIAKVVDEHGILVGQEWAGHASPATTRHYVGVRQEQLQDACRSLDWAS